MVKQSGSNAEIVYKTAGWGCSLVIYSYTKEKASLYTNTSLQTENNLCYVIYLHIILYIAKL